MVSNAEIRATFTSFITRIIANESLNYKKKMSCRRKVELNLTDGLVEKMSLSYFDKGIFRALEEKINYKKLENEMSDPRYYNAMKRLSDRQKLILYLNIIEDMSIKDVAIFIGVSENSISNSKSQAIKKFLESIRGDK
ncbi:MAG: sigma factor-like helix-turn-helix DNA-binding protein [Clostridia bacterium]|nr:sigma factor-like helix-turn-helix DNA-binding protein [Clostridia bacterium]